MTTKNTLFDIELAKTLRYEGGWADDKDDAGGQTWKGVSRKNWPNWAGWKIIDNHKKLPNFPKNLEIPELNQLVSEFYFANFWSVLKPTSVKNAKVIAVMFDTAVNMGISSAVKLAQKVLKIPETGVLDTLTISKLNNIK